MPVAGGYQVAAWVVSPDDSDPKAVYTVALNGSVVQTVTVDQSVGGTNSNPDNTGLWVTLVGTVDVTEGDTITVQVTASGTGCTRSDTVKLVRIS